jgi:hypothetical protein
MEPESPIGMVYILKVVPMGLICDSERAQEEENLVRFGLFLIRKVIPFQ